MAEVATVVISVGAVSMIVWMCYLNKDKKTKFVAVNNKNKAEDETEE